MERTRHAGDARSIDGIKVLQLGKYYLPVFGGLESHLKDLCEGLKEKGNRAACIVSDTSKFGSAGQLNGIHVRRVGKLFRHLPPVNPALPFYLGSSQNRFDIVHLHMPNPSAEVSCLLTRPKNLVVTYHSDIVDKIGASLYLPLQKRLLANAKRIIVSSDRYITASPVLKRFRKKCVVIPLGIETGRFNAVDDRMVDRIKKSGKGPFFLFVGRLVRYKGLNYLLKAMQNVDGTLLIVGDGPMRDLLCSQARRYGLREKVRFFPRVRNDALPSFYHAADALVLPSITKAEAYGIVQLESMACGKPVISTALGTGVESVNVHGKTGLVVPPRDVPALSAAMTTLGADEKLRSRLGMHAKKWVEENFTRDVMAGKVIRVYHEALAKRRQSLQKR